MYKGSDRLLRIKLRVGALILALQSVAIQGTWAAASCYERSKPEFAMSNSTFESGVVDLNLKETCEIAARIRHGYGTGLSFAVVAEDMVIQSGEVSPTDGQMDSPDENVVIFVDPDKLPIGTYELRVFWEASMKPAAMLRATPLKTYMLIVRSE